MEQVCCCPPAVSTTDGTVYRCPICKTAGTAVDVVTVKTLLTEHALRRFVTADYRFCPDTDCKVVYVAASGQSFTVADVRVSVWHKQPFGQRMICYCFDENERAMRAEIEQHGTSNAVNRVRQHIDAGRCACEVRNPRGSCCLGDVTAAVKRVAAVVQADRKQV